MRNPNVDALAEALRGLLPRFVAVTAGEQRHQHEGDDDPWWECYDCIRTLARWLTTGPTPALVISDTVLTDEVAATLHPEPTIYVNNPAAAQHIGNQARAVLSRAARGEETT